MADISLGHSLRRLPIDNQIEPDEDDQNPVVHKEAASRAYRGWTSWSLQAFKKTGYGFYWLTEQHVKSQAKVLANEFLKFGYDRVNLDSGWQDQSLDEFGRQQLDRIRFPNGMEDLSSFLTHRGLKLGLYFLPGIDGRAVDNQMPVLNTEYTADQLIYCPPKKYYGNDIEQEKNKKNCTRPLANAFKAGYALNYSHPGSRMYLNSVVDQLYSWNVSLVKLDGNVPGSAFKLNTGQSCDTRQDILEWRRAIDERFENEWKYVGSRQKIWLAVSWEIPTRLGPILDLAVDSWRVAIDIEAYGDRMTTFDRVVRNTKKAAVWSSVEENREFSGFIDLDAVLVSDMSIEESRSMVTIWSMLGTPFYSGDDLTKLSKERKELLMNPEVLELQALTGQNPSRLHHFNVTKILQPPTRQISLENGDVERENYDEQGCETLKNRLKLVKESLGLEPSWSEKDDFYEYCNSIKKRRKFGLKLSKNNGTTSLSLDDQRKEEDSEVEDEWTRMVWVHESDESGEIYLAVVNAGHQEWFDIPIELEMSLKDLEVLSESTRSKRMNYRLRDVWRREDVGVISFDSKFKVQLNIHDCVLLKLSIQ
ncbi:family 27 glycoside hydrolase [Phakopsora pachyrhizi]|nr:family 27 glycoside hydrolase [Phakopsora pachyrhizi]